MRLTLKALRVNKNLTQEEAAKAIGVSKYTWAIKVAKRTTLNKREMITNDG